MIAVKGLYRHGKVELQEEPPDVQQAEVTVIFLDQDDENWHLMLQIHNELEPHRKIAEEAYSEMTAQK